jgi:ABC-2 type transport system ATP-binding protein
MWGEIKKLRDDGVTIFLTTHYMDEADKLCDTIAIIDNGAIIIQGTPVELKNSVGADLITLGFADQNISAEVKNLLTEKFQPEKIDSENNSVRFYIKDGDRALPEILRALDAAKLAAQTIALSKPSLDDVFLKYTGRSLREDK